ncbi:MAG: sigma 54-interacting transcriptional regulator, partial [Deltaproteobacteria bacterium]|nr:sigma 54-interacting transcriptional regulator [Deltaproteobacteria bacterium]
MAYLKVSGLQAVKIDKSFFTVGVGQSYDLGLGGVNNRVLFTLQTKDDVTFLIPGNEKIRRNGKSLSVTTRLEPCDRLEWDRGVAVFLDDVPEDKSTSPDALAGKCLEVLQQASQLLEQRKSISSVLQMLLEGLVSMSGAEVGCLISDLGNDSGWEYLAVCGDDLSHCANREQRQSLISHTIVNEAVRERRPIYVESIIGHAWATQASVLGSRIFSIGCLPLMVDSRVFGCLFLYTQTPGKSIRKDALHELGILATQATLLLAAHSELSHAKREKVESQTESQSKFNLLFDREAPSSPMREVEERVNRLAPSPLSLLILGETGTGKELIAREVHRKSPWSSGPFVAINCGAIPPALIESTLFGYVRGAFTGANRDMPGKFVAASGGTLFLDEIADLPLDLQVKLLRVLQERVVEPVGSDRAISIDFRLVAATHQDLEVLVRENRFRQDLFYRINGAIIQLPPLRLRGNDPVILADFFLRRIN